MTQELYLVDVEGTLLQVDDQTKLLEPLEQDPQMCDVFLWLVAGYT